MNLPQRVALSARAIETEEGLQGIVRASLREGSLVRLRGFSVGFSASKDKSKAYIEKGSLFFYGNRGDIAENYLSGRVSGSLKLDEFLDKEAKSDASQQFFNNHYLIPFEAMGFSSPSMAHNVESTLLYIEDNIFDVLENMKRKDISIPNGKGRSAASRKSYAAFNGFPEAMRVMALESRSYLAYTGTEHSVSTFPSTPKKIIVQAPVLKMVKWTERKPAAEGNASAVTDYKASVA